MVIIAAPTNLQAATRFLERWPTSPIYTILIPLVLRGLLIMLKLSTSNSSAVCITTCPNVSITVDYTKAYCDYSVKLTSSVDLAYYTSLQLCAPYYYQSTSVLNRCIPSGTIPSSLYNTTISAGSSTINMGALITGGTTLATKTIADLKTTWPLLLASTATAIIFSVIWLYISQWFIAPFVWLSILSVNVVMIIAAVLGYFYWNSRNVAFNSGNAANGLVNVTVAGFSYNTNVAFLDTTSAVTQSTVNIALGIFITLVIIAALILLLTLVMIKRISMAIEIVNEASQAFRKLPGIRKIEILMLELVPLVYCAPLLVVFAYFIIITLYLYSCNGTVTIALLNMTYSNPYNVYYMMWYHLAGFIWTYYTILGLAQLTVAGAVADWYWSSDKNTSLTGAVTKSGYRALRYHLGSVLIGALLITIVELIRVYVLTIQRQIAKLKNPYLNFLVACAQCCLKCIQLIMKWINRHAYGLIH